MDIEIAYFVFRNAEKELDKDGKSSIQTFSIVEDALKGTDKNVNSYFFVEGADKPFSEQKMIFNKLKWKRHFLDDKAEKEDISHALVDSDKLIIEAIDNFIARAKAKKREKTTDVGEINKKPRVKKVYKSNSYKVIDEILLYKIADAGILYTYLHGINQDKDGNKVFHFDRHEDIKEIIDNYSENKG